MTTLKNLREAVDEAGWACETALKAISTAKDAEAKIKKFRAALGRLEYVIRKKEEKEE